MLDTNTPSFQHPHMYLIFSKQELEWLIPIIETKRPFCTESEIDICDAILFGLRKALCRYENIMKILIGQNNAPEND